MALPPPGHLPSGAWISWGPSAQGRVR